MQAMKKIVGLLLFNFHCLNDVRISQLQIRASIQEQIRMPIGKQIWSHRSLKPRVTRVTKSPTALCGLPSRPTTSQPPLQIFKFKARCRHCRLSGEKIFWISAACRCALWSDDHCELSTQQSDAWQCTCPPMSPGSLMIHLLAAVCDLFESTALNRSPSVLLRKKPWSAPEVHLSRSLGAL